MAVTFSVEIFEDEWTLVALLAAGVALSRAYVDGQAAQLVAVPEGLAWSTATSGTVQIDLEFSADARRTEKGYLLSVPISKSAATNVHVTQPRDNIEIATVPGKNLCRLERGAGSSFTASIPATSAIMLTWTLPSERPYTIARADYQGQLKGSALLWTATFDVEMFDTGFVTVALMTNAITLGELQLDGQRATVLEENSHFATVIQGTSMHQVEGQFQVPMESSAGPPKAVVMIPRVPISNFALPLPGNKELSALPGANVVTSEGEGQTRAEVYVPMSEQVIFSRVDAVPVELRAQTRANASVYHAVRPEEGVLHTRAIVVYKITRGKTNQLTVSAPNNVQINRTASPGGSVSD